jgi:hypothetical protein
MGQAGLDVWGKKKGRCGHPWGRKGKKRKKGRVGELGFWPERLRE